ncbi:MAG: DUF4410 domain-containing protein [Candidatus Eisenbacteria bacterium]
MASLTFKRLVLGAALVLAVALIGCAPMGKYQLIKFPTESAATFRNVEVGTVEAGVTEDDLEPGTPSELRLAIIKAVERTKMYEKVGSDLAGASQTIMIKPKIVEMNNGSQFLRWLIGFGVGKAHMEVTCQFVDTATGSVFATGSFTGEIKAGLFGGLSNQGKLSGQVAGAIASFLRKYR